MNEFEPFDVKSFLNRLLGKGDLSGLINTIQRNVPMDQQQQQPELPQKLSKGNFTFRMMYELIQNLLEVGPLNQVCRLSRLTLSFS